MDIYADEGIYGTQVGKRQDFQRLISDCIDGKVDYIITKAIAQELDELGYKTPRGMGNWQDTTVLGIIKNEKYKGDI